MKEIFKLNNFENKDPKLVGDVMVNPEAIDVSEDDKIEDSTNNQVYDRNSQLESKDNQVTEKIEKKEDLSKQALDFFQNLLQNKPIKFISEVADLLKDGNINAIPNAIANCPDISQFQQVILEQFSKRGIVEKKEDLTVVDLGKLIELDNNYFRPSLSNQFRGDSNKIGTELFINHDKVASYFGKGKKYEILFYTFNNLPVISKEDYEDGKRETKDLFYIPETAKSAFDVDSIKKSRFYLNFKDVVKRYSYSETIYAKNQEEIDLLAHQVLLIYHPQYGDGYRDEDNNLIVKYKDGKYRPIRTKFFEQYPQVKLGKDENKYTLTPSKLFADDALSELIQNNLIQMSDFKEFKSSRFRTREFKKINSSGFVTVHGTDGKGIRYYVGKGKELSENPNARVSKINEKLAVVINKNKNDQRYISHYFHLTDSDNTDLTVSKPSSSSATQRTGTFLATREITKTTIYNNENIKKEDDDNSQSLEKFRKLFDKVEKIRSDCGVDLFEKMTDEVHWQTISSALLETTKDLSEVSQFINKYGIDYFADFISADVSIEDFDRYVSLGKNLEEETAKSVLLKYNEILDSVNKTKDKIKSVINFEVEQPILNISDIQLRAKKILMDFADLSAQAKLKGSDIAFIELLKKLDNIKQEVVIFASLFKQVAKSKDINLNELLGVKLVNSTGGNISNFDQQEIIEIYKNNREQYPKKLLENTGQDLNKSLQVTDNHFYLVKLNDQIVSYIRYKDLPNGRVYVGSFNVRPEAKSSAIGDALIKTTLEQEGKEKVIEGVVYSKHPKFESYIKYLESLGFKVVGEIDDYEGTGEKFYKIERQPDAKVAIEKSAA